jgi:ribosomal protein S18 acetylase RimI-like enzyme
VNSSASGAVRRALARDVDRVVALWAELWEHHARIDPRHALRRDAGPEIRRLISADLRDPDALVLLYEQSDACGLCMTRIQQAPPIGLETRRAEIGELYVRADARRCGVGRALVGDALAWVRERRVERVVVRVEARNELGQAFWRSLGFADAMDVLERRL